MLFVTGFPGFIGKRLVRALLDEDSSAQVVCLAEARMEQTARHSAAELGGQVEVLTGDITGRRLGLSAEDYERLTAETKAVFHLAAIYNLAVPFDIAQKVNVDGTGHIVEFCENCERLERHNYVSTAYVAGPRKGRVYEHELIMGQWFKNHYESTKFQAEVWVREAMDKVPTTIYRPAIVVGDSRTGETQKFDGPYYFLRTIARSVHDHLPIAQFGRAEAPFNCVPVDFIVGARVAAPDAPAALGETLHLVDPEPVTAAEVGRIFSREYAGKEPRMRLPPRLVEDAARVKPISDAYGGAPPPAIRYLNHPARVHT